MAAALYASGREESMTPETWIAFGVLGATILLFLSDRLRLDLVGLMALLTLTLTGILEPSEAFAGFGDDLVLIIAGLFVVGAGLLRTGVAAAMGQVLGRLAGTRPTRLLVVTMVLVALLSAVMSSTGTVAIFLPVVIGLARRSGVAPSKLLIPLAFASLLGGMLTLIGTPPNIVVSRELQARGLEPFGFFEFTPIGLVMLAIGIVFMAILGRRLLPQRTSPLGSGAESISLAELARAYGLQDRIWRVRLGEGSGLAGRTPAETRLREAYGVTVLDVVEHPSRLRDLVRPESLRDAVDPSKLLDAIHPSKLLGDEEEVDPGASLHPGVELVLLGEGTAVRRLCREQELEALQDVGELPHSSAFAEVLLTPRSRLVGRTLRGSRFRQQYHLTVLSLLRLGRPVAGPLGDERLRFGDTLLVQGGRDELETLREETRDFVVVAGGSGEAGSGIRIGARGWTSVGILVAMLVLMTAGWVPAAVAVLLAAVAMVLSRCLTMREAYRSINWEAVVLIAAMLPVATALTKTGGMELVVGGITSSLGQLGPVAVMAGLFVLTSVFSQFISNTATTVLVAPIAFEAAVLMDASPRAFLITVAIAASTAFATPIATPVNTLVMTPGGYRFTDYGKVGIGLQLLIGIATLLLAPLLFPLGG